MAVLGCLARRGGLEGQVLSHEGLPRAGAKVAIFPSEPLHFGLDKIAWATTNGEGTFRIKLPAGDYAVSVNGEAHAGPDNTFITLSEKGTLKLPSPLRLGPPGTQVQGVLKNGRGSATDGLVILMPDGPEPRPPMGQIRLVQSRHGRYRIALKPGTYFLQASGRGSHQAGEWLEVGHSHLTKDLKLLPDPATAPSEVQDWVRREAKPLPSPDPGAPSVVLPALEELAKDSTVLGLGEATHGTREFFQFAHYCLKGLAEAGLCHTFAVEMNLVEAFKIDSYIQGEGPDPVAQVPAPFLTAEMRDMINWMRDFNRNRPQGPKVRFYGVDIDPPGPPFEAALRYFREADPGAARIMERDLKDLASATVGSAKGREARTRAWAETIRVLLARLEAGKKRLTLQRGAQAYDRQHQTLVLLGQFVPLAGPWLSGSQAREQAMADNVRWILCREAPSARILLWAHNDHIAKAPMGHSGFPAMGRLLSQTLGERYKTVGMTFNQGSFLAEGTHSLVPYHVGPEKEATLDAALASAGMPCLFLDLRRAPASGKVGAWFRAPQGAWFMTLKFSPSAIQEHILAATVLDQFDGLLFVENTTSCQPWIIGG